MRSQIQRYVQLQIIKFILNNETKMSIFSAYFSPFSGSSGSNEDDLTVKLGDIARINIMIKNAIEKNGQTTVC